MIEIVGKSCYHRHQKRPYRYSSEYQAWLAAALTRNEQAITRAAEAHARMLIRRFGRSFLSDKRGSGYADST